MIVGSTLGGASPPPPRRGPREPARLRGRGLHGRGLRGRGHGSAEEASRLRRRRRLRAPRRLRRRPVSSQSPAPHPPPSPPRAPRVAAAGGTAAGALARRGRRVPDVVQPDFVLQRLLELAAHLLQLAGWWAGRRGACSRAASAISAKRFGAEHQEATTPMTSASGAPPNKDAEICRG